MRRIEFAIATCSESAGKVRVGDGLKIAAALFLWYIDTQILVRERYVDIGPDLNWIKSNESKFGPISASEMISDHGPKREKSLG